ncbi:type VI secretion protein IcmF/TssM N-terminal domain-containing protein [Botrimarina sp.]|uniref:type VI secretion protein IcmF/TssM N-terminal domain-containing protein n=1 Tax=Botrimarina sp. TaxID=2795802 RepID=UPI0032F0576E
MVRKLGALFGKAAVAPFAAIGRGAAAGGPLAWALHGVLLLAALGALWWLNGYLGLDRMVHAPSWVLRSAWLPLLLLIAYSAVWAGYLAWRAFTEPDAASPFPDLDNAWRQAAGALARSGRVLGDKPLVLVLGQPGDRDGALLGALGVNATCGPAPSEPHAPLRVAADSRATYLLCHDASVLSVCTERLAQRRAMARQRPAALPVEARVPVALRVGAEGPPVPLAAEPLAQRGVDTMHHGDEPRSDPLLTREEALTARRRLEHLLRLVSRDSGPGLPIDSVALVVPCDAADSDASAHQAGAAIREDLAAVAAVAGLRCPVGVVMSELQHVEGCGALLHTLPAERRVRRLGVDLPSDTTCTSYAIAEAVDWLTGELTPALCGRLYQVDADLADNAALFALKSALSDRSGRIAELLSTGLAAGGPAAWPLAGCHLVATGDPLGGSQAFGFGVLDRLAEAPSHARWTAEALAADRSAHRWANRGYVALAATAAAVAVLVAV